MIIALAGRRVDATDAKEPRLPLQNVELVRTRVRDMLKTQQATAVVSAAACGADLIGLSEAGRLGLRRRVVLPFDRGRFRESSVTDRPGDWGPLYDQVLDDLEGTGDLVSMDKNSDDEAYAEANRAILDEAVALGAESQDTVVAALVWDGASRGSGDLTEAFGAEARKRGLSVIEVCTL
jgi:hypothetical protein